MNAELENKLVKDFPKIFKDIYTDPRTTCMTWGLECGDGWFDIIYECCKNIQRVIDKNQCPQAKACQIKEKYGTLRFYINYNYPILSEEDETEMAKIPNWEKSFALIDDIISETEEKSSHICERCGRYGEINSGGWISCLCKFCRKKKNHE